MDHYSKQSRKRPTSPLVNSRQNIQISQEEQGLLELENYIKYGNCSCLKTSSTSSSSENNTNRCRCIKSHKFETTRQQFSNNKEQKKLKDKFTNPSKMQTVENWLTISLHIRNEVKLGTGLIEMDNMLDTQNHNFPNTLTNLSPYFKTFSSTEVEILSTSKAQKSGTLVNKFKGYLQSTFNQTTTNLQQPSSFPYLNDLPQTNETSSKNQNMQNGETQVYDIDRAVATYFLLFKTIQSDMNVNNINQFFDDPLNFYQLTGKIRVIMENNCVYIENKSNQSIFIQSSYLDCLIKDKNGLKRPDKLSAIYRAFK